MPFFTFNAKAVAQVFDALEVQAIARDPLALELQERRIDPSSGRERPVEDMLAWWLNEAARFPQGQVTVVSMSSGLGDHAIHVPDDHITADAVQLAIETLVPGRGNELILQEDAGSGPASPPEYARLLAAAGQAAAPPAGQPDNAVAPRAPIAGGLS